MMEMYHALIILLIALGNVIISQATNEDVIAGYSTFFNQEGDKLSIDESKSLMNKLASDYVSLPEDYRVKFSMLNDKIRSIQDLLSKEPDCSIPVIKSWFNETNKFRSNINIKPLLDEKSNILFERCQRKFELMLTSGMLRQNEASLWKSMKIPLRKSFNSVRDLFKQDANIAKAVKDGFGTILALEDSSHSIDKFDDDWTEFIEKLNKRAAKLKVKIFKGLDPKLCETLDVMKVFLNLYQNKLNLDSFDEAKRDALERIIVYCAIKDYNADDILLNQGLQHIDMLYSRVYGNEPVNPDKTKNILEKLISLNRDRRDPKGNEILRRVNNDMIPVGNTICSLDDLKRLSNNYQNMTSLNMKKYYDYYFRSYLRVCAAVLNLGQDSADQTWKEEQEELISYLEPEVEWVLRPEISQKTLERGLAYYFLAQGMDGGDSIKNLSKVKKAMNKELKNFCSKLKSPKAEIYDQFNLLMSKLIMSGVSHPMGSFQRDSQLWMVTDQICKLYSENKLVPSEIVKEMGNSSASMIEQSTSTSILNMPIPGSLSSPRIGHRTPMMTPGSPFIGSLSPGPFKSMGHFEISRDGRFGSGRSLNPGTSESGGSSSRRRTDVKLT